MDCLLNLAEGALTDLVTNHIWADQFRPFQLLGIVYLGLVQPASSVRQNLFSLPCIVTYSDLLRTVNPSYKALYADTTDANINIKKGWLKPSSSGQCEATRITRLCMLSLYSNANS